MSSIGVVHLVRACNGIEPFRNFMTSYATDPGAAGRPLLIVYKGFSDLSETQSYAEMLTGYDVRTLFISDRGFDISAYRHAAAAFDMDYLCFLNSFSVILDPHWLEKLYACLLQPGVGVVGAGGSWETAIPIYPHVLEALRNKPPLIRILSRLRIAYALASSGLPSYPNYHLRTNAFMMRREILLSLNGMNTRTKKQAYRFEHHRLSMTRQIEAMGLRPLVVGKDGRGYEKEEWRLSNTFWQGDQGNLLVADNQTRLYESRDMEGRKEMWRRAWREQAVMPAPPSEPLCELHLLH